MQNKSYGRSDGKGRRTKVTLWNRAVDDVAGVVARLALRTEVRGDFKIQGTTFF